jgi:hypothetical protein
MLLISEGVGPELSLERVSHRLRLHCWGKIYLSSPNPAAHRGENKGLKEEVNGGKEGLQPASRGLINELCA